MNHLARVLGAECERQGLSGAELAERSGVSQTGVAAVLRGDRDPQFSTLLKLLDGLGRSLGWLAAEIKHRPVTGGIK